MDAPEVGNVGEPDVGAEGEDACGGAIDFGVEAVGDDLAVIRPAGPGAILDAAHEFAVVREQGGVGGELTEEKCRPVGHGAERHVLREPVGVLGDVEDADGPAVRFCDVASALVVEAEGHAVGQHGFGGPGGEFESGCELEASSIGRGGFKRGSVRGSLGPRQRRQRGSEESE